MSTEQNERDLVTLSEQQNVRTFSTLKLIFPSAVVTKKSPKPPKIIAVKELRSFRVPGLTSEAKCHLGLLVIKKATYGVYMLSSERTPAIAARSKTSPYDEAQALALPTQIPVCVQAIPSDVKDAPYLYPSLNFTHLVKLNCASPTDLHSNPPALDPLVFYPELEHPSDRRPRTSRCRNLEQICEEHREYWRGARYGGVSGSDDGSGGDGGEDGAGNGGAAGDAGNGGADGDAGDGGAAGDAGDDGAAGRVGKDGNAWCGRGGVGDGGADRRDGGDGSVGNSGADEQDEIKGHASEFKSGREFLQYTLVLEGLVCDMDEGDSRIYSGANLEGISFEGSYSSLYLYSCLVLYFGVATSCDAMWTLLSDTLLL